MIINKTLQLAYKNYRAVNIKRSESLCKKLYNMWRYIKPDKLQSFINLLSPRTLNSIEALDLGMNYQKRGHFIEADIIYRKILEHYPENTDVQALLNAIQILPK